MDETFNFRLIKVLDLHQTMGSKLYIFEHQRTGLQVYYSFPTNYTLELKVSFYTPQINEKGTTHILEHLLCHTKSRYKSKWFMPSYSNKKTNFNAATFDDHTVFDVSSESITEFRQVTKSMLDSIFRKKFDFTDEEIAYESAYIKDYDTVDGVIYNELKRGLEEVENIADEYVNKIAFANTHYQYAPGGSIEGVVDITREELEEYYFKYYKLSNCKIFAIGGFDLFKLFEYLDKTICEGVEFKEEVEVVPYEEPRIAQKARVPFFAPVGYPKGENIYVWGLQLPRIESLDEKLVYEAAIRALFDGPQGPFEEILKQRLSSFYRKTILSERINAPYLRITFYNVPEGKEEDIKNILDKYLLEIKYIGLEESTYKDAMSAIAREYFNPGYPSEMFDKLYYTFKDDVMCKSNERRLISTFKDIDIENLSEVCGLITDEVFRFDFVMYPDVNYIGNFEDDIIANYEDYKLYTPNIEEYGVILANNYRLNCKKQEVTKKLADLRSSLNKIKFEKFNVDGVKIYKFDDESRVVIFTFDLKGLTDEELCYMPVLVKLINTKLPRSYDSDVFVDAHVFQTKVLDEYFKLELKCYFRNDEIDVSFFDEIYNLITDVAPMEIAMFMMSALPSSKKNGSESLTRDLALQMDSNNIPYRGTIHRKTFYNALFQAGSSDSDKAFEAYCDFHDACYKVLRRSNLVIMTTSGVLNKYEAGIKPEKLVYAVASFAEDVEQRKEKVKFDKDVTYHYANLRSAATGVIKPENLRNYQFGEKMVYDRMLYNFMYILFRKLGLSYQIDGTLAGDFATITSHSIRCCDDYKQAFSACGIFFENFNGNLNYYKSMAVDLMLEMFKGAINPKINAFRYMESGIDFAEILASPDAIETLTTEGLKEIGESIQKASEEAKVYAVCGPGSSPYTLDDYEFNYDYIFPEFLI